MRVTLPFKTICCVFVLFSICVSPVRAQQGSDPVVTDSSPALVLQYAHDNLSPDSRLYNGYEYIRNGTPAKGFPFYDSDGLQKARLSYDGILYRDIPLEYDLVLDEVVIPDFTGKALIGLISEKVGHFSIGAHYFRYVAAGAGAGAPPAGFYEVLLSSGPTTLFARREKKLVFPSNRDDPARYDQRNDYYLVHDGRYYPVDSKDALLHALKDKSDAVKKYIRTARIRFKKRLETALVRTTAYYTQLSH
ncbi:MAG TPA: hypothetical protein VHE54_01595 [Puia sp.]|nr:hypothetical protein [Puia sp.]